MGPLVSLKNGVARLQELLLRWTPLSTHLFLQVWWRIHFFLSVSLISLSSLSLKALRRVENSEWRELWIARVIYSSPNWDPVFAFRLYEGVPPIPSLFPVTWYRSWILICYWYSYISETFGFGSLLWVVLSRHLYERHETKSSFARACSRGTGDRSSLFHLSIANSCESFDQMLVDAVLQCIHAPFLLWQHGGTFTNVR